MYSISLLLSSVRAVFAKVFLAIGSCLLLCIGFANLFPVSIAAAATPAYVRVIHASPFVATADVFVDGQALLTSFEFGKKGTLGLIGAYSYNSCSKFANFAA